MVHREDVATTTVGLAGVGTAAALRHEALEQAYQGAPRPNLPHVNLPLFHERRLLVPGTKGRPAYLTGAVLGTVSAPTAAVGINRMVTRRKRKAPANTSKRDEQKKPTFLEAGFQGARQAVVDRTNTVSNPAPAPLVAGNYLAGLGIGSATGGLSHLAMRKAPIPGHGKAAIATVAGTTAGALSLPAQSALTSRVSHGKYEVTATGVRRAKKKRVPASRMASVHEGRARHGGDARRYRSETVPGGVGKLDSALDYRGSDISPKRKRAIVSAVVGPPILGDIAQAGTAASMAPPPLRRETAVRTIAGSQGGGHAGTIAGAYGAAYLAGKSPHFRQGAEFLNTKVEQAQSAIRRKAGLKEPTEKLGAKVLRKSPGFVQRAAGSKVVRAAAAPLRKYPAVAAAGGLIGGAIGGQAGLQAGYGSALNREKKWRVEQASKRHGPTATHGSRVAKAEKQLTVKERRRLAHQKQVSAALSMTAGTAGLASLGITLAQKHPRVKPLKQHLPALLATGAGVGGANAFLGAHVQQKEAKQQLAPLPRRTVVIVKPDEEATKRDGDGRRRLHNAGVGAAVGAGVGGVALPYAIFGGVNTEIRRKSETPERDYPSKKQFRAGYNPRNVGRTVRDFTRPSAGKKVVAILAGTGGVLGAVPGATVGALKSPKRKDEEASKRDNSDQRRRQRNAAIAGTAGGAVGAAGTHGWATHGAIQESNSGRLFRGEPPLTRKQKLTMVSPKGIYRSIRRAPARERAFYLGALGVGATAVGGPAAAAGALKPPRETASKALGLRLRPTGFRRAPAIRAGYTRQTRYPGGMTRVSTVRGGLA